MSFRKFLAATTLIALPLFTVHVVKKTTWGEMRAIPEARQKGEKTATLAIVEFSDFQCPMCASVQPAIKQYMEAYKGKIRFIYKYYPLTTVHKNARPAAQAAECAAQQGKFWEYHDKLFENQVQWAKLDNPSEFFTTLAIAVKLDLPKFQACVADPNQGWAVDADIRDAKDRIVNATPTFFIGETRVVGQQFMTEGARMIEQGLRK